MENDPSLTPPLRYGIFHMFCRFFFESFPQCEWWINVHTCNFAKQNFTIMIWKQWQQSSNGAWLVVGASKLLVIFNVKKYLDLYASFNVGEGKHYVWYLQRQHCMAIRISEQRFSVYCRLQLLVYSRLVTKNSENSICNVYCIFRKKEPKYFLCTTKLSSIFVFALE